MEKVQNYHDFLNERGQEQIEMLDKFYEENSDFVEEEMMQYEN